MRQIPLGHSGIMVSELCLGTMTWGRQNTPAEGHAQIDMALDHGVDFLDTAEMYPTQPVQADTIGLTETIIGDWVAARARRNDLVIATKILGEGNGFERDGAPIDGPSLRAACEASLRRLRTDVIDLYQLHWPNRGSYHFRSNWHYDPSGQDTQATLRNMQDVLATLQALQAEGKIRAFGLSNETTWGMGRWLDLARVNDWPRAVSIQNEYSLLCRHFDLDLAELCHHEDVALLAFSPLAAGLLTGKYQGNTTPTTSRRARTPDLGGRATAQVFPAIEAYLQIARSHGLDPAQMALAWCRARPVPVIPIIGATTPAQLKTNLGAVDITLSAEILDAIEGVRRDHPMPF